MPPYDVGLLCSLDALSAAEESTRWNADRDEWPVVGPAIEWRRFRCEALVSEVLGEEFLDCCRIQAARRRHRRSRRAVTVVDEPDIVGRAHHVEVEVRVDLRPLRIGEVGYVVLRAKQTRLFSTPESETHLPLQLVGVLQRCELLGDLEDRC